MLWSFQDIVLNTQDLEHLKDRRGISIRYWEDFGTIGWDSSLQTFFVILSGEEDELFWWLGITPAEIPNYEKLKEVIADLFDAPLEAFEFAPSNLVEEAINGYRICS